MSRTSEINSICLISNRKDVVEFCEQAVGALAKVFTEEKVSISLIRFSKLLILDVASIEVDEELISLFISNNRTNNVICLLPFDCVQIKKNLIYSTFSEIVPLPCSFQILKEKVESLVTKIDISHKIAFPQMNYLYAKNHPVFTSFIGSSNVMVQLKNDILHIANNNQSVLLLGETGTGKTTIAKIIHELSQRNENPFIAESIPNLPEPLASSILFGSTEGAFTDAKKRHGLFKSANKGTLFLDEIGFASQMIQGLLLTVIESGIIRSVGKDKEEVVDVRLIFATNSDLKEMRQKGTFREDFYQRISAHCIHIPPLRDHISDLPEITQALLKVHNKELHKYSLEKLMNYVWPGNVRELQNCLNRASTFCKGSIITPEYIILEK